VTFRSSLARLAGRLVGWLVSRMERGLSPVSLLVFRRLSSVCQMNLTNFVKLMGFAVWIARPTSPRPCVCFIILWDSQLTFHLRCISPFGLLHYVLDLITKTHRLSKFLSGSTSILPSVAHNCSIMDFVATIPPDLRPALPPRPAAGYPISGEFFASVCSYGRQQQESVSPFCLWWHKTVCLRPHTQASPLFACKCI